MWQVNSLIQLSSQGVFSCNDPSANANLKTAKFHSNGETIIIALDDGMQAWKFKPDNSLEQVDSIHVSGWEGIKDLQLLGEDSDENKLIAGSIDQNFVSMWGLNLDVLNACRDQLITFDSLVENQMPLDNNPLPKIKQQPKPKADETLFQSTLLPKIDQSSVSMQIRNQHTPKLKNPRKPSLEESAKHSPPTPADLADRLLEKHTSISSNLSKRLVNIKLVKQSWDNGGVKACIETMMLLKDSSVWVDILKLLNTNPKLVSTLELCEMLLPIITELLFEAHQEY